MHIGSSSAAEDALDDESCLADLNNRRFCYGQHAKPLPTPPFPHNPARGRDGACSHGSWLCHDQRPQHLRGKMSEEIPAVRNKAVQSRQSVEALKTDVTLLKSLGVAVDAMKGRLDGLQATVTGSAH